MTKRNEPCPCGSGKKYKKCCLINNQQKALEKEKSVSRKDIIYEVSPDFELHIDELKAFPVSFNFAFFAEAIHFEKMEKIILEEIPNSFTQELLELFQETPFESKFLASSLVRSSDFLHDYNDVDGIKITDLVQSCMGEDFIVRGKEKVIPFATTKLHYRQKPLARSRSKKLLEAIKDAKEIGADGDMIQYKLHAFYTLWGFMFIEEEKIDEFRFLKSIYSKEGRKTVTQKIESLCKILSDKAGFEIIPIFLDFSLDLDGIVDEIYDFRAYFNSKKIYRPSDVREYSLYKKKRRFFGLF